MPETSRLPSIQAGARLSLSHRRLAQGRCRWRKCTLSHMEEQIRRPSIDKSKQNCCSYNVIPKKRNIPSLMTRRSAQWRPHLIRLVIRFGTSRISTECGSSSQSESLKVPKKGERDPIRLLWQAVMGFSFDDVSIPVDSGPSGRARGPRPTHFC